MATGNKINRTVVKQYSYHRRIKKYAKKLTSRLVRRRLNKDME